MQRERINRYVIWGALLLLVLLHQDYWQWDKASLWFGFLPFPLAYHAALSLLAAAVWWVAATYFWPAELEWTDSDPPGSSAVADDSAGGRAR